VVPADRAPRKWLGVGIIAAVLFVVTAVAVRSAGVTEFDENVMAGMYALRRPELDPVVQFVTDLGSYQPVTVITFLLAFVLGYRTRRLLEPLVLLAAVEASASLVEVVKELTDRARPPLAGMLGEPVFDFSFPSGHTASGAVLYVLGAVLLAHTQTPHAGQRSLVAAGCLLGVLIGLSRVYLGHHWLTDAVGGWLLAAFLTGVGMVFVTAHPRPAAIPIVGDVAAHAVSSRPSWAIGAAAER
jgi:undecaprenyl-diphosphatase